MQQILRDIGVIARALDSISNIEFKQFDLTKGQYLYVVRICENPGIFPDKLADMIKVDRTTAARAIKKLEANGFLVKRDDPVNKKTKLLFPTDKARNIYPYILREHQHSNAVALNGFQEEEIKQFKEFLIRVSNNISSDWEYVKKGNKRHY